MKSYTIIIFIALGLCISSSLTGQNVKNAAESMKAPTEQDYLDALAFFDSNEVQADELLKEAMNTCMTYLMYQNDSQGKISLFEKAAQHQP